MPKMVQTVSNSIPSLLTMVKMVKQWLLQTNCQTLLMLASVVKSARSLQTSGHRPHPPWVLHIAGAIQTLYS